MQVARTASFLVLATLSCFSFADRIDWITTPTKTYVVTPAAVLAEGSLSLVVWSDDGKDALLLLSQPTKRGTDAGDYLGWLLETFKPLDAPSTSKLAEWDKATNSIKLVWQADLPGSEIGQIGWFKHSHRFLFSTSTPDLQDKTKQTCSIWIGDAAQNPVRPHTLIDGLKESPGIYFAPSAPRAVLEISDNAPIASAGEVSGSNSQIAMHLSEYSDTGEVIARREYTSDPKDGFVVLRWDITGTRYHLDRYFERKIVERIALTDSGPQALGEVKDYVVPIPAPPIFTVARHSVPLKYRKSKALVGGYWLSTAGQSMHPEQLISTGLARVEINPSQDTILIAQNGVVSARTILPVPDDALSRLNQQLRLQALASAKQLGLGMIMFANDNDDVLPGGDSAGDDISPYLMNDDLLGDLNYTPPSDLNLTSIESPAETIIGYVDGPGGRAYMYSDGHVRWKNNP